MNDPQKAMSLLAESIKDERIRPYVRYGPNGPDITLLMEAKSKHDVYGAASPSNQVLVDLILDLWGGSESVTVTHMMRHLTNTELAQVFEALAWARGFQNESRIFDAS